MKLEEKILQYLRVSANLNCEILDYKRDYVGEKYNTIKGYYMMGDDIYFNFKNGRSYAGKDVSLFKPILRPLEDLTKEIEIDGVKLVPIEYFIDSYNPNLRDEIIDILRVDKNPYYINYGYVLKLLEWNFDVFSLIPEGKAINYNDYIKNVR